MSWKCQCVRARPACAREEMAPRATFFFPLSSTWREIEWALSLPSAKCGCMCEMERRSIRKFSQQRYLLLASIREKRVPSSLCFWRTFFFLPSKMGSSSHIPRSCLGHNDDHRLNFFIFKFGIPCLQFLEDMRSIQNKVKETLPSLINPLKDDLLMAKAGWLNCPKHF